MAKFVITAKVVEEVTYEVDAADEEAAVTHDPNNKQTSLVLTRRTLDAEVIGYPYRKITQEGSSEKLA